MTAVAILGIAATAIVSASSLLAQEGPHEFVAGDFTRIEATNALAMMTTVAERCPQFRVNNKRLADVFKLAGINSPKDLTPNDRENLWAARAQLLGASHIVCMLAWDEYGEAQLKIIQDQPAWTSGGGTISGLLSKSDSLGFDIAAPHPSRSP